MELKFEGNIVRIGNSKGVVVPKAILHNLEDYENKKFAITIEEVEDKGSSAENE